MPSYADKIVFVNAITDDSSAQRLAAKFSFQGIPTSFFLSADGQVVEGYTGALTEQDLRARLDRLASQ